MPRVTLTKTTLGGGYATALTTVTMTAADTSDLNQFLLSGGGNEVILIHNTGGSPATVTLTSATDEKNRLGHITTESIAAGVIKAFGPTELAGWRQTGGYFYLQASSTDVKFGVLKLR